MAGKVDAYAACPYYRRNERQVIHCEGIEEGSSLHLAFSAPQQLLDYRNQYCRRCWRKCLIAEMLNRKYEYE